MEEGIHYQIIPDREDEQSWNVRILKGQYTETVLKYGTVRFNEIPKNMSFDFKIVYTPDTELKVSSVDLQEFAGYMLEKIMAQGVEEGSVITKEIKNGKSE
jgi:hypothetical protein|tara:strand:- start:964 stop:1266 length:303 start_codon:yes stop_codon:yes gene_type:complete